MQLPIPTESLRRTPVFARIVQEYPALELFPAAVVMSILVHWRDGFTNPAKSDAEVAAYLLSWEGRMRIGGLAYKMMVQGNMVIDKTV